MGTGLNAQAGYAERACTELRSVTGIPFHLSDAPVAATQDVGPFVHLSSALKLTAVRLSKICNDLRLLASGRARGSATYTCPPSRQAEHDAGKGQSCNTGSRKSGASRVIGNDTTITLSAEVGQLQLNAFGPVIITTLPDSIGMLTAASAALARRCVGGIRPDVENLGTHARRSLGVVTALSPHIGYELATEVAAEAAATGCEISDVVSCRGVLTSSDVEHILARARGAPAGC